MEFSNRLKKASIIILGLSLFTFSVVILANPHDSDHPLIAVYYFGGWAGHKQGSETWDKDAPMHATEKLEKQFEARKPLWGWRDDTDAIMKKQIDLASNNGIDCFFFCWYWRDNHSKINESKIESDPLHDSIRRFMSAKNNNKMKFAMMIANHNGAEISGKTNWLSMIDYMSNHYFNHTCYLKFDGKPVISIYFPKEAYPFMDDMRKEAIKNGFPGLYIIALGDKSQPDADAYSAYNIHEWKPEIPKKRAYHYLTQYAENEWEKRGYDYPLVMTGWDMRPWEKGNGVKNVYYIKRSASQFGKHLDKAYQYLDKCTLKNKLIFIYAWNEYGEGGYLVPCKGDSKGKFLRQVKLAKKRNNK